MLKFNGNVLFVVISKTLVLFSFVFQTVHGTLPAVELDFSKPAGCLSLSLDRWCELFVCLEFSAVYLLLSCVVFLLRCSEVVYLTSASWDVGRSRNQ